MANASNAFTSHAAALPLVFDIGATRGVVTIDEAERASVLPLLGAFSRVTSDVSVGRDGSATLAGGLARRSASMGESAGNETAAITCVACGATTGATGESPVNAVANASESSPRSAESVGRSGAGVAAGANAWGGAGGGSDLT